MEPVNSNSQRALLALLLFYGVASLVHFVHNAELIAEYPNLPASWTRVDIYLAWVALTSIGLAGWLLVSRGYRRVGLLVLAAYAALGMDSLGHYLLAPLAAHSLAMNLTILVDVAAAALVLVEVARQTALGILRGRSPT
jgi:hypothetical protein